MGLTVVPAPVPTGRRVRRAGVGALACSALLLGAGCGSTARKAANPPPGTGYAPASPAAAATRPQPRTPRVKAPKRPQAHVVDPLTAGRTSDVAPGAPSDAEVRRELAQAMGYKAGEQHSAKSLVDKALLNPDGLVVAPASAPVAVQAMINGANQVARLPYVYGGGHSGHWEDSSYDCSGSVSFALAAAGFLKSQLDSTALAKWGAPGPGKWVTIYANAGHAWMTVAGVRFDTSGRSGPRGSRWQGATRSVAGFVQRHPIGL